MDIVDSSGPEESHDEDEAHVAAAEIQADQSAGERTRPSNDDALPDIDYRLTREEVRHVYIKQDSYNKTLSLT